MEGWAETITDEHGKKCELKLSPYSKCKEDPPAPCNEAVCMPGFRGNGWECSDIDECTDDLLIHECHLDAICSNNIGSYDCTCRAGTWGDGWFDCSTEYCPDGWYGPNSTLCRMIPENGHCATYDSEGHDENFCLDFQCNVGYQRECNEADKNCYELGINTTSNYVNSSFLVFQDETDVNCEDLDECAIFEDPDAKDYYIPWSLQPCAKDAICTNTIGSFTCTCKPGYSQLNPEGAMDWTKYLG